MAANHDREVAVAAASSDRPVVSPFRRSSAEAYRKDPVVGRTVGRPSDVIQYAKGGT
ncbi:hypothetical protein [Haladaptatus sp. DYF46]|uniref:hypothetical protein n=1 Tax=Haladaptatus sp. DYF46 TaxID=2886041 RepID=UPI001E5B7105|nr:hypothetical protein [Haladaptatus sp. DYF46]